MQTTNTEGLANALAIEDGWIQLSPYGEFGHRLGTQCVSREAADQMVSAFNSLGGRLRRFFTGCPLYVGHPDCPGMVPAQEDRTVYGVFNALEARADGLYGRVTLTPAGSDLIARRAYRAVSPYWLAEEMPDSTDVRRWRPIQLKSVGLTNQPNLPVQPLLNQQPESPGGTPSPGTSAYAAEASDNAWREQVAVLTRERDAVQESLGRERQARIRLLLEVALAAGRITPAEFKPWAASLANEAEFETLSGELARREPCLKTTGIAIDVAVRKGETAPGAGAAHQVLAMANERMRQVDCPWDEAWAWVKSSRPYLFLLMQTQ
jgi:phage I-like protein